MHVKFVDLAREYQLLAPLLHECLERVGQSGHYILGPEVEAFEQEFARYCGSRHAVAVANGSDALMLSLFCLGVGAGDEVVTPANSFIASAWVIARTGARIVFCDVREDDMNLDPECLKKVVNERTKVIMPVHLTGRVARMEEIQAIANSCGAKVMEDAAQAVGADRFGKRAGSFGWCAGFSLYPLKNLHGYGDGGVITCDDDDFAAHLRQYRNHGLKNRDVCEFWGINSRLDELQAAFLRCKLPRLDEWNQRFQAIARRYQQSLGDHYCLPPWEESESPVFHRYIIQHPERDKLAEFLLKRGVETKVNYPIALHLQPAARELGYQLGDFPVSERLCERILSLPMHAQMRDDEVDYVIEQMLAYVPQGQAVV